MIKEFIDSGAGVAALFILYLIEKIAAQVEKRTEKKRQAAQRVEEERKKADKELKSSMEFINEIDRRVKHVLTGFLANFAPLRTFVIHFHNGTYTDAGLSIPKLTIRHEIKARYPVLPITDTHQEIPVPSFLDSMITRIRVKGEYYLRGRDEVALVDSPDHNPLFNNWLIYYDVQSMYCTAIRDKSGKIVAALVLQFRAQSRLNEQDLIEINEQKKRIEFIYDHI